MKRFIQVCSHPRNLRLESAWQANARGPQFEIKTGLICVHLPSRTPFGPRARRGETAGVPPVFACTVPQAQARHERCGES